ncbi:hypothetical protein SAMN04488005_0761 [Yoonia tamlensis]|uniref:Uncharacterized protein n=1 Tax=Yoonia tamlensis TaxID=390270 RepID=A0A1I6FYU2_9RHOB|nr:hypothetical protein [Yoonia tamlensis]SFR35102.1 hypothetical protein SAMN04488005_0761 [Yoonia tamlensis]
MIRNLLDVETPDRWVECDDFSYPEGGNPWTEIYTEQICQEIAAAVAITDPDTIQRLRFQLAATAEHLTDAVGFVGGAATLSQKHLWADKLDISLGKVVGELDDATEHLSSVCIRDNAGKMRFYPASEMRTRVERTRDAIFDLRQLLGAVEKSAEKTEGGTNHAQTLQLIVDAMTEVFIDIVGIQHVKRTAFEKDIDGLFPEFIREAAKPFLAVHYPKLKASKRSVEKLNAQIQEAVARYSQRR